MAHNSNINNDDKLLKSTWLYVAIILAAIPSIQSIITWSWSSQFTLTQLYVRIFSIVAFMVQIYVIYKAYTIGFKSSNIFKGAHKWVQLCLIIWGLAALLSLILSIETLNRSALLTSFVSMRYAVHIIFFIALIHIVKYSAYYTPDWDKKYFAIMMGGGLVYLALLTFFIIFVPNPTNDIWQGGLPSATSIRHIANYMALFSLAIAAVALGAEKQKYIMALIALLAISIFIAWSGSRASIIGMMISLIFAMIMVKKHYNLKKLIMLPATVFLGTILSILLPVPHEAYGIIRFYNKINSGGDSSSGRLELWTNSIYEIMQQPFIGHGAGNFGKNMNQIYGYDLDNPHQFILQYLYDWGFIGGLAGLSLIAWLGFKIWTARFQSPQLVFAASASFIMMLSIGLLEGMFYHPIKITLAIMLIAPLFAKSSMSGKANRSPVRRHII